MCLFHVNALDSRKVSSSSHVANTVEYIFCFHFKYIFKISLLTVHNADITHYGPIMLCFPGKC